jgi:hypothetical protein
MMSVDITATFVKKVEDGWQGDARLYRLSTPVPYSRTDIDGETGELETTEHTTEYVVASANVVMFSGPEVLIFPATKEGEVVSWGEIGGYRGGLSHEEAIRGNDWNYIS